MADVYSGRILREHNDAECLVQDLYTFRDRLQDIFQILGWQTKILANEDLKIVKNGMKTHFGHLTVSEDKATWYHNGNLGQIQFPAYWLGSDPVSFLGYRFYSVKPEFQYVLKLHPEHMNPEWHWREKDKADIKVLRTLVGNADLNLLESQMISFTC